LLLLSATEIQWQPPRRRHRNYVISAPSLPDKFKNLRPLRVS
jgi:hypothetical protein